MKAKKFDSDFDTEKDVTSMLDLAERLEQTASNE
jgi:hypothetical protein